MQAMAELLLTVLLVAGVIALAPALIWALRGIKPKRGGGVLGASMHGVAAGYETQQEHLQIAKQQKRQGGRENGDPPSQVG
jgi:hypothetical protein